MTHRSFCGLPAVVWKGQKAGLGRSGLRAGCLCLRALWGLRVPGVGSPCPAVPAPAQSGLPGGMPATSATQKWATELQGRESQSPGTSAAGEARRPLGQPCGHLWLKGNEELEATGERKQSNQGAGRTPRRKPGRGLNLTTRGEGHPHRPSPLLRPLQHPPLMESRARNAPEKDEDWLPGALLRG